MRYEDGIDLPCMKIGEHDELARWHLERCRKRTRASVYYLLDERTRLAGCHMIRDARGASDRSRRASSASSASAAR